MPSNPQPTASRVNAGLPYYAPVYFQGPMQHKHQEVGARNLSVPFHMTVLVSCQLRGPSTRGSSVATPTYTPHSVEHWQVAATAKGLAGGMWSYTQGTYQVICACTYITGYASIQGAVSWHTSHWALASSPSASTWCATSPYAQRRPSNH